MSINVRIPLNLYTNTLVNIVYLYMLFNCIRIYTIIFHKLFFNKLTIKNNLLF